MTAEKIWTVYLVTSALIFLVIGLIGTFIDGDDRKNWERLSIVATQSFVWIIRVAFILLTVSGIWLLIQIIGSD